jgi:putative ABC transport system permease protein
VPADLQHSAARWSLDWRHWTSDLRQAVRAVARRPGLSLVVAGSLALVIGTCTAQLSYLDFLLWAKLPVPHPEGLVWLAVRSPQSGDTATSYLDYLDYRDQNTVLSGLAAWGPFGTTAETGGATVHVWGHVVSGNYFSVLGAGMALGRPLGAEDDRDGAERVTVLSQGLWRRVCNGDPAILGRSLRLNGQPFTVVGVAPEGFLGGGMPAELYVPLAQQQYVRLTRHEMMRDRGVAWLSLLGRLRPGVELGRARAALSSLANRLQREDAARPPKRIDIGANDTLVGAGDREFLLPAARRLAAFVGLLLLLGCANVANMLTISATGRQRELGVRAALGAGRGRLVRQLLAESVALALLGGAMGIVLAAWETRLIDSYLSTSPAGLGGWGWAGGWVHLRLDARVLGLAFLLCLGTGVLSGLVPAWRAASRADLVSALKGMPEGGRPAKRWGWLGPSGATELLVVLQAALSVWLLAATGVFALGLWRLAHTSPGFATDNLWAAAFSMPDRKPDGSPFEPRAAYLRLAEEVRRLPGVAAASLSWGIPLSGLDRGTEVTLPERPGQSFDVALSIVGAGYFETLGIPLRLGRAFDERDGERMPAAAVVNESLAHRLWPGESAVGKTVVLEGGGREKPRAAAEVIGVVADSRFVTVGEPPRPLLYLAFEQNFRRLMALVVRATGPRLNLAPVLRREIGRHHPDVAIVDLVPFSMNLKRSLATQRMHTQVVALFAVLGLALAALGVGSATGAAVARRRHEIGIRMALGARPGGVLVQVLRRALALAAAGSVLGLAATLAGERLLASFLPGIPTVPEPLTLVAAAGVLLAVALLASLQPARRAARVDPVQAIAGPPG